jgi:hypothetical protein
MNYSNNLKPNIIKTINEINSNIPSIQLSKNSIILLKNILFNLEIATKNWIELCKKSLKITKKQYINPNNHIPEFVKQELVLNKHSIYSYKFSINQRIFTVNFIFFQNEIVNKKILIQYFKHVYQWLYVAQIYSTHKCAYNTNINIYFHNKTKIIPNKNTELTNTNVNTAFTWACNKNNNYNEVNIYRKEEWFKAFIHESFHLLGLDFAYISNLSNYNLILQKLFKTKIDFLLFETYCETWANILNSLYISYNQSYRVKNTHNWTMNILKKTNYLLNQERAFALLQSSKILYHNNIQYSDFFNKDNISYIETTPIFSYYLFKSILLFHTDTFLSWSYKYNNNSIQFNSQNVNMFYHLISLLYNKPLFIQNMELVQSYITKNLPKKGNVYKTLRMTLHQI